MDVWPHPRVGSMSASAPDLELDYLLACLAHGLDESRPWPHPPRGLDGKRVLRLAEQNRISGLVHALGPAPEELREPLRIERYRWLAHAEESRTRVQRVLSALTTAGLEVIVLKGWAYIYSIYGGDASRRLCSDVDLLVHPRDAESAGKILRSIGCAPEPPLWPGYAQRYHNGEIYFFAPLTELKKDSFSVGLHWGLLHVPSYDPARVDVGGLFARARRLTVTGVDVFDLGEADSIVYACAHLGLHHRFEPDLFRFYDIAALIRSASGLDWDAVARTASDWEVILPVRWALDRVESFWPGSIPVSARQGLAQLHPSRRERFVDRWQAWAKGRSAFDSPLVWLTFPDWRQRPLIFLQELFPSTDYLRLRYGPAALKAWPFLYFRRLGRGILALLRRGI